MNPKGVFVTGTDTGVGKTIVSAAIARHLHNKGLRAGVMKPVTSGSTVTGGAPVSEDAQLLRWAACSDAPAGDTSPYVLREPIAPSEAARLEGVTINRWRIRDSFERLAGSHDFMVVEGAGGLLVPLADDLMVADLAEDLGLPLIIVARPGLGTINHTLMTCECAISRGISILGFILNGQEAPPGKAEAYASRLIARFSGLPLLGVLKRYGGFDEKEIVIRMADALDREPLADALKGERE